jgi:hypothetical protein
VNAGIEIANDAVAINAPSIQASVNQQSAISNK